MADYLIFHLFCIIAAVIFAIKGSPEACALCFVAAAISLVANALLRIKFNYDDRKW